MTECSTKIRGRIKDNILKNNKLDIKDNKIKSSTKENKLFFNIIEKRNTNVMEDRRKKKNNLMEGKTNTDKNTNIFKKKPADPSSLQQKGCKLRRRAVFIAVEAERDGFGETNAEKCEQVGASGSRRRRRVASYSSNSPQNMATHFVVPHCTLLG